MATPPKKPLTPPKTHKPHKPPVKDCCGALGARTSDSLTPIFLGFRTEFLRGLFYRLLFNYLLKNVFMLPHIGSATEKTRDAMGLRALENLNAYFSGNRPLDQVT